MQVAAALNIEHCKAVKPSWRRKTQWPDDLYGKTSAWHRYGRSFQSKLGLIVVGVESSGSRGRAVKLGVSTFCCLREQVSSTSWLRR